MRAYARPLMITALGQPEEQCRALESVPIKAGEAGVL